MGQLWSTCRNEPRVLFDEDRPVHDGSYARNISQVFVRVRVPQSSVATLSSTSSSSSSDSSSNEQTDIVSSEDYCDWDEDIEFVIDTSDGDPNELNDSGQEELFRSRFDSENLEVVLESLNKYHFVTGFRIRVQNSEKRRNILERVVMFWDMRLLNHMADYVNDVEKHYKNSLGDDKCFIAGMADLRSSYSRFLAIFCKFLFPSYDNFHQISAQTSVVFYKMKTRMFKKYQNLQRREMFSDLYNADSIITLVFEAGNESLKNESRKLLQVLH